MRISSWYLVASGWVDSRFAANAPIQSPDGATSPYGKATHDDLSVASLLRYSCHRFTTILNSQISTLSFKPLAGQALWAERRVNGLPCGRAGASSF